MYYTVGEMAKRLCTAPSTLRYYDREGLLPFVERSENGIRLFKDSDFEWLKMISCLKTAGMPLKDIKVFVMLAMRGDDTVEERLRMFLEQRERVMQQIKGLQKTLDVLDFKCWYYQTAMEHGTASVPRQMAEGDLPQRFRAVRRELRGQ